MTVSEDVIPMPRPEEWSGIWGWFLTEDSQGSQGANIGRSQAEHLRLETLLTPGQDSGAGRERCVRVPCVVGQWHPLMFRAVYQGHRECSKHWTVLFVSLSLRLLLLFP